MNTKYIIGKGLHNVFYTLWMEAGVEAGRKPFFICNLSQDLNSAEEKAEKIAGCKVTYDPCYSGRKFRISKPLINNLEDTVYFGKHVGKTVIKILSVDPGYWMFMIENLNFGSLKFQNLIKNTSEYKAEVEKHNQETIKRQLEKENAEPCPQGKVNITGEVISIQTKDTDWGIVKKMLVKDERGFKVWGTVPKIKNETEDDKLEKGKNVSFDCNLTPSSDDNKFGFYKRPTKAKLI